MAHKAFFYTGKTYNGATYTETYVRESRRIRIDYTPTEDARPYFRHNNRRYYLDDFMRTFYPSYKPLEIVSADGERVSLHGQEADQYYKPLFVELSEDGETVRVYRYEGSETDYN